MITTHELRQPLESQPYALERHEKDLRQRLMVQSDTSSGKDQEKKKSSSKAGKVMKGLQILNRWWDLLFDERQGKRWATDKVCRSLGNLGTKSKRIMGEEESARWQGY